MVSIHGRLLFNLTKDSIRNENMQKAPPGEWIYR